ncbi:MAG TPA: lysophospholipid acyltransferase family protein [Microvirga sp.]|jgi:hypothetical protein|nr:lysophospholipid acyltransferase family protein [Microvirga sp.]
MSVLKRLLRSRAAQEALGALAAGYLGLVRRTNRFVVDPPDAYDRIGPMPVIAAMWHGQHFMVPFARRAGDPAVSLVSRSADGELNAIVLRRLGIRAVRGSGARGRDALRKGGASALRALLRALKAGEIAVLTADVPKTARRCGRGIVVLAQHSGRPIVPVAVATSRRLTFGSWDRASLGLPFGRGAIVIGDPVRVPREASPDTIEAARQAVERGLDAVHQRAFALVGAEDPGAGLRASAAPRRERAA